MEYLEFLKSKIEIAKDSGFQISRSELNPDYFRDGVGYLQAAEEEIEAPTLFDFMPELLGRHKAGLGRKSDGI